MRHDGERDQQRLQIEGLGGRVVLGEVDEGVVGLLAEWRILVADQGDDGGATGLAELQRRHRFTCGARERRDDDDRVWPQRVVAGDHQFRRDLHEGGKARAALQQKGGGLHEDGGTAGTEEEDVLRPLGQRVTDGGVDGGGQRHRAGLDLQETVGSEIQHQVTAG